VGKGKGKNEKKEAGGEGRRKSRERGTKLKRIKRGCVFSFSLLLWPDENVKLPL
jgi:hypothetical protein